jgi:hypothetical protein
VRRGEERGERESEREKTTPLFLFIEMGDHLTLHPFKFHFGTRGGSGMVILFGSSESLAKMTSWRICLGRWERWRSSCDWCWVGIKTILCLLTLLTRKRKKRQLLHRVLMKSFDLFKLMFVMTLMRVRMQSTLIQLIQTSHLVSKASISKHSWEGRGQRSEVREGGREGLTDCA